MKAAVEIAIPVFAPAASGIAATVEIVPLWAATKEGARIYVSWFSLGIGGWKLRQPIQRGLTLGPPGFLEHLRCLFFRRSHRRFGYRDFQCTDSQIENCNPFRSGYGISELFR